MKPLIVANWKMNLSFDEELYLASYNYDKFVELTKQENHKIILCPSFVSLYSLSQIFKATQVNIGAQNCSKIRSVNQLQNITNFVYRRKLRKI